MLLFDGKSTFKIKFRNLKYVSMCYEMAIQGGHMFWAAQ